MKTLLSVVALALTLNSSWGQGYVDFRNGPLTFRTTADRCVYLDGVGGQKLVGREYVAGLWFVAGDDLAAVDGRVSPVRGRRVGVICPFRSPTTSLPGIWLVPSDANVSFILDGVTIGEVAALQVRVWNNSKFISFETAFAAGEYGVSDPFTYVVPPLGSTADAYYMDNLRAFSMLPQTGAGILVHDIAAAEESDRVIQAEFIVNAYGQLKEPFSVDYQTEDGTALAGQDYVAANGTLHFASGETSKRVSITLIADGSVEPDETFFLRLSNPVNAFLGRAVASCTITEVRIAGIQSDAVTSFHTVLNRRYAVERSLDTVDWEPVPGASNVLGTGGIVIIIDRGAGCEAMRTYRARLIEE